MYFLNVQSLCILYYLSLEYVNVAGFFEMNIALSHDSHTDSQEDKQICYEGAQMWRSRMRGPLDILHLKSLVDHKVISLWRLSPTQADFLVKQEDKVKAHRFLRSNGINHTVIIMNVQSRISPDYIEADTWTESALRVGHRMNWYRYQTNNIINEYLQYLKDSYPSICYLETIGHTVEKRPIKMIRISNGNPNNKGILLTGGVHSREWISISAVLYITNEIATKFDQQPKELKNKDWYIVPVVNPDGYEYSQNKDRLWRKNRYKRRTACVGTDLNRNFIKDWNISGIRESDECSENYSGPHAFSEPESTAIGNLIINLKGKLKASVDIHSYGQLILYPWSARSYPTPDENIHKVMAENMSKAIYNLTKAKYTFGHTYHKIYPVTGSLMDFAYSNGIRHSYAIETRDTGNFGFLLPPKYILTTSAELFEAVKYLAMTLEPTIRRRRDSWL